MSRSREDIVRIVQGLLAKAGSTQHPQEAESLLGKISELRLQHRITDAEVAAASQSVDTIVHDVIRMSTCATRVIMMCCEALHWAGCSTGIVGGASSLADGRAGRTVIHVWGTRESIDIGVSVMQHLLRACSDRTSDLMSGIGGQGVAMMLLQASSGADMYEQVCGAMALRLIAMREHSEQQERSSSLPVLLDQARARMHETTTVTTEVVEHRMPSPVAVTLADAISITPHVAPSSPSDDRGD